MASFSILVKMLGKSFEENLSEGSLDSFYRLACLPQDAWADEEGKLELDEQQDCENFGWKRRGNVTKFTFSRRFDTCDGNDYVMEVPRAPRIKMCSSEAEGTNFSREEPLTWYG